MLSPVSNTQITFSKEAYLLTVLSSLKLLLVSLCFLLCVFSYFAISRLGIQQTDGESFIVFSYPFVELICSTDPRE